MTNVIVLIDFVKLIHFNERIYMEKILNRPESLYCRLMWWKGWYHSEPNHSCWPATSQTLHWDVFSRVMTTLWVRGWVIRSSIKQTYHFVGLSCSMADSQSVGMCLGFFLFPSGFHSWMKLCEFLLRIVFGNSQKMLKSNFISDFIFAPSFYGKRKLKINYWGTLFGVMSCWTAHSWVRCPILNEHDGMRVCDIHSNWWACEY